MGSLLRKKTYGLSICTQLMSTYQGETLETIGSIDSSEAFTEGGSEIWVNLLNKSDIRDAKQRKKE